MMSRWAPSLFTIPAGHPAPPGVGWGYPAATAPFMMTATAHPSPAAGNPPSPVRIALAVLGWILMLGAALSLLIVPFSVTFLLFAAGTVIVFVAFRPSPPMTWRSWIAFFAGPVVIIAVLSLFGDDRIRQWRPHPAGYIPAWFICLNAFRHFRHMFSRPPA